MQIQIIDWNISFKCHVDQIIDYLKAKMRDGMPCIINLQEVRGHTYDKLKSLFGEESTAYSLNLRKRGKFEGRDREQGTAIIAVNCYLRDYSLVHASLVPERTLSAKIEIGGESIGVLNFHSLTGKRYKRGKASNFASMASFIYENESQLDFLCFDANEPFKGYQDWSKVEFYDNFDKGKGASLILGKKRVHGLSDSLRSYYDDNGILNLNEPMMKSHKTKRFDYIFHSNKWAVESIEYPMEESLKASSDHSMVIGVFEKKV